MPDTTSKVWIDSSFNDADPASKNAYVEYRPAAADNIGSRSVPIVYKTVEAKPTTLDAKISYLQELEAKIELLNVAQEYFAFVGPKFEGVYVSLVEFSTGQKDEVHFKDINIIYSTGYGSISGSLNKRVVYTGGREVLALEDVPLWYYNDLTASGSLSYWVNYSNFSGDVTTSGVLVPFHTSEVDYNLEYGGFNDPTPGAVNRIITIDFAGWVDNGLNADVYSALHGFKSHYTLEVSISGGGIGVNYLDLYSADTSTSGVPLDIYCSLVDLASVNAEAATTLGRTNYCRGDVYSTAERNRPLTMDIDLYSIKITNFSLDIDEHTDASGNISVDILDDECPVSTSGTYFMVDGLRVPVTFSGIQDGYRMFYDPEDDFSTLEGPTTFTVHAENECNRSLEQDFYLTFGYIVEYDNGEDQAGGMDYGFDSKVAVRVSAENYASCPQGTALAWEFVSVPQFNQDLGASIVGRFFADDADDMPAQIKPISTAYFYGKSFEVIINAKDFAGNEMEPLILKYRIEDKPEN